MIKAPMTFNRWRIEAAEKKIPASDFIDAQYDSPDDIQPTDVVLLLSTPRSGSTMLCDLLRLNDGFIAHEYFAPFQYMPILARRWGCLRGSALDEAAFIRALCRFRTSKRGWLGINLQGSHLSYFSKMEAQFSGVRFHYVHLVRRDQLAQAVSYDIASQTNQWSSEFASRTDPKYSFPRILRKLRVIHNQNALFESFLMVRGVQYQTIVYEDMVVNPEQALRAFPCFPSERPLSLMPSLRRQANVQTAGWKQRFAEDLLADQSVQNLEMQQSAKMRQVLKIPRMRIT